jgi:hypothetical protein
MSQRRDTPRYYTPYDSDTDTGESGSGSDTDEDYDSSELPDYEDARIRREEDPRYAIIRSAGPNLNTSAQQLKYMEHAPGAEYDASTNITSLQDLVYLNPPKTTITSLFSLKAENRNRRTFPSPLNFEIKLPRVFKNVTKFQLVQLSFPNNTVSLIIQTSSFYATFEEVLLLEGVSQECLPACADAIMSGMAANSFGMVEMGRVNSNGEPLMSVISVPDGVYTNDQFVEQLNIESNNTPPFNIISYDDFKAQFQATGDISVLFNEPGDYFRSRIKPGQLYTNFGKDTIMNMYYTQNYIDSIPDITDKITFNAYYYPVLKELLATGRGRPFLQMGEYTYSQIQELVMNQFLGLDNDDYYSIASTNRDVLDRFRQHYTFELKNVNKYRWSFEESQNQFRCIHNSLHTSCKKDIGGSYSTIFAGQLRLAGLTTKSFQTLKNVKNENYTILKSLEGRLSTIISQYHLVSSVAYLGGGEYIAREQRFGAEELAADENFNSMFNMTSVFGNEYNKYPGAVFTFSSFLDYHSTISSYYNLTQNAISTISSIYGLAGAEHQAYIANKYTNILPTSYIQNQPHNNDMGVGVSFVGNQYLYVPGTPVSRLLGGGEVDCVEQCRKAIEKILLKWYGCIPVSNIIISPSYRLGLNDFNFSSISYISSILSASTSRNLNYLMQVNNDQSFNNMDIAMTENYDITNETTGQVKLMYAKILTAGVGSAEIAQTVIQNPVVFENPLGKLDKLQFKIYYDDEALTPAWLVIPFDVGFLDWDATFQIDEEVGFASRDSGWGHNPTVPIPNNPAALQYMALTSTNNPNNK